jgi:hypothetical protein
MLKILKHMQYYVVLFGLMIVVAIPFMLEEKPKENFKQENNQQYLAPSELFIDEPFANEQLDSIANEIDEIEESEGFVPADYEEDPLQYDVNIITEWP